MLGAERRVRLGFTEEAEYFNGIGFDFSILLPVAYSCFCGIPAFLPAGSEELGCPPGWRPT